MTVPRLAPRDRRALLLGVVAAAVAVSWMTIAKPTVRALRDVSAALRSERDLYARETRLLAAAGAFPAQLEESGGHLLNVASRLFAGESPAVAGAQLIRYVQDAARPAPALITRMEPLPAEEDSAGVHRLSLRVEGETDLEGLVTLLYLLEGGPKLVPVEDLRVRGGRTAAAGGMEVLTFEFVARGLSLVPADGAARDGAARDGQP